MLLQGKQLCASGCLSVDPSTVGPFTFHQVTVSINHLLTCSPSTNMIEHKALSLILGGAVLVPPRKVQRGEQTKEGRDRLIRSSYKTVWKLVLRICKTL